MRAQFSLVVFALVLSQVFLGAGCRTTPTVEDQQSALASYQVSVALVHEARRGAANGDATEADLKWRQALTELLQGEKRDPDNAELQYLLGMTYFVGFRRHVDAELHLRNALRIKENEYVEAEYLLGTVLVDAGRPRDAIPYLEKARANLLYQTPYFAEQELGWAKFKLERYDEAARHLKNAIVAQPDLCGAYVRLADVENARGDHRAVKSALLDFLARCDTDRLRNDVGGTLLAYAWYRLGMAHLKLGDDATAGDAFNTCEERFPTEPVVKECRAARALIP